MGKANVKKGLIRASFFKGGTWGTFAECNLTGTNLAEIMDSAVQIYRRMGLIGRYYFTLESGEIFAISEE